MDADRDEIDRLRALPFLRGPIAVEPLSGGMTNRNYLVRAGATAYVGRVATDRVPLGIDRRNEAACQREAHARGVAPAVVHHEAGLLVSAHLPGRTLTEADLRDPALLSRLAVVLRALHREVVDPGAALGFSVFSTVETYARTARELGAELPDDLDGLLEGARRLAGRVTPVAPVLCHNDLLAANVLDDGGRLWLVDWEYAGVGDPRFDLACVSANHGLSGPLDEAFLAAYWGRSDARDLEDLGVFKAVARLREALWGAIQTVASEVAFDYRGYADGHFRAYREACRGLGLSGQ